MNVVVIANLALTWLTLAVTMIAMLALLVGGWLMLIAWRRHDTRHRPPGPASNPSACSPAEDPWALSGQRLLAEANKAQTDPFLDEDPFDLDDPDDNDDDDLPYREPW